MRSDEKQTPRIKLWWVLALLGGCALGGILLGLGAGKMVRKALRISEAQSQISAGAASSPVAASEAESEKKGAGSETVSSGGL